MNENIIAERLRRAMFVKGMKQVELCEKTGIDKGSISHYLKGTYKPNGEKLTLLAKALGVTPDWLLGRDEYEVTPRYEVAKDSFIYGLNDEEMSLVESYRKADATKKQIVRLALGMPL